MLAVRGSLQTVGRSGCAAGGFPAVGMVRVAVLLLTLHSRPHWTLRLQVLAPPPDPCQRKRSDIPSQVDDREGFVASLLHFTPFRGSTLYPLCCRYISLSLTLSSARPARVMASRLRRNRKRAGVRVEPYVRKLIRESRGSRVVSPPRPLPAYHSDPPEVVHPEPALLGRTLRRRCNANSLAPVLGRPDQDT